MLTAVRAPSELAKRRVAGMWQGCEYLLNYLNYNSKTYSDKLHNCVYSIPSRFDNVSLGILRILTLR